jgi:hypothetical protein
MKLKYLVLVSSVVFLSFLGKTTVSFAIPPNTPVDIPPDPKTPPTNPVVDPPDPNKPRKPLPPTPGSSRTPLDTKTPPTNPNIDSVEPGVPPTKPDVDRLDPKSEKKAKPSKSNTLNPTIPTWQAFNRVDFRTPLSRGRF